MNGFRRLGFVVAFVLSLMGLAVGPTQAFAQTSSSLHAENVDQRIGASGSRRMSTWADLQRSGPQAGQLDVVTRTRTAVKFAGYTGGVYILLRNADNAVIGVTDLHQFGVDGTWVGRYDRTDYWQEYFDPRVAAATTHMEIIQLHAPKNRVVDILREIERIKREAEHTCRELRLCF